MSRSAMWMHRDTHKKHAWRVFYAWLPVSVVLTVIVALTLQDAEGTMQMTESVQAVVVPSSVAEAHASWDITKLLREYSGSL